MVSGSVYIQNIATDYITLSVYTTDANTVGLRNCLQIIKVGEGTTTGDTGIGWFSRNGGNMLTYILSFMGSIDASYGLGPPYYYDGYMTYQRNTFWYFPLSNISYNSKIFAGPNFNTSVSGSFSYGTTNSTRANLYFPSTGIYQINFVFQISTAIVSYGCINFKYNPTTPNIPHAYQDNNSLVAVYYSPLGSYGGCVMGSVCITDIINDYITLSVFAEGGGASTGSRSSLQIIKVGENKIVY
jgi:hypothetical protein